MRIELFWPGEAEHAGEIGLRQLALAEGIGEYVVKTVYVPLEQAEALGAALLMAGRRAALARPRGSRAARGHLRLVTSGRG